METTSQSAVRIAVTGAAGQIGYQLLFRLASGALCGQDQPIMLQLLETPTALHTLQGVAMELEDCAFPLLQRIVQTDDPRVAFDQADIALLVGARPRAQGMERRALLEANAAIFSAQGRALNDVANPDVKVVVVGNPSNTNALIAQQNAPRLAAENFTSMMRLDHNRALNQLSHKIQKPIDQIKKIVVWGNHSLSQYPDLSFAEVAGKPLLPHFSDTAWIQQTFIPTVQQRGAAIIAARGLSSAASAANAAIDHLRSWLQHTPTDDWISMGVPSDGSYGIPPGVIFGFPVIASKGRYEIVKDLPVSDDGQQRLDASYTELIAEKEAIAHLLQRSS